MSFNSGRCGARLSTYSALAGCFASSFWTSRHVPASLTNHSVTSSVAEARISRATPTNLPLQTTHESESPVTLQRPRQSCCFRRQLEALLHGTLQAWLVVDGEELPLLAASGPFSWHPTWNPNMHFGRVVKERPNEPAMLFWRGSFGCVIF